MILPLLLMLLVNVTTEHQAAYKAAQARVAQALAKLKDKNARPTVQDAEEYRAAREALRQADEARRADCGNAVPQDDGTCK